MQTPKASMNASLEVSQRTSPSAQTSLKSSPSTNRTARQLKVAGSDSDSIASPKPSSKTLKKSPKVLERGSPHSPITEKKRPAKLSELESQLTQLQDELKMARDQLSSSEGLKRQAQEEAEEAKKQLAAMSARLEESQQQLMEISTSEDARVQELRKLSHDRDRAWQSELQAIQNQHSMDSAALTTARNEIQKLKRQLEKMAESQATHCMQAETAFAEIQSLRTELSETLPLVERMKKELNDCKESEAHALEVARGAQEQLEAAMADAESLRSEKLSAMKAYDNLESEFQQSKSQVSSLENLVIKLQGDLNNKSSDDSKEIIDKQEGDDKLRAEIESLKLEVDQLKSALEASELRYQGEYIQSTLQIRNAYDQVELARLEASAREAELDAELKKARNTLEELKSQLMSKEMNIEIEEENENSEIDLKQLKEDLEDLKAVLLDKETKFENTAKENEMLKAEIQKREMERSKENEATKAAEREALMKLGYATEEADKSSRKATRVAEQLDAAQTTNTELEAELRRLKVQSDQWRKAAEAAAAILSSGKDGKFDSSYNTIAAEMNSPLSDDMDDDSPKKKNGNMLKKIGVLWKKGQK